MSITSEKNSTKCTGKVQKLGLPKDVLEFVGYGGEKYLGGNFDDNSDNELLVVHASGMPAEMCWKH